jgi:c-di-GMP-binding flagellar brake protein YcgR
MIEPKRERRTRGRIAVSVPATVATQDTTQKQAAVTRDLSMTGVFLYADERIAEGSKIEIVLMLPTELGLGDKQWACCQASVVRVEDGDGQRVGVAARIERMDVLPEILS